MMAHDVPLAIAHIAHDRHCLAGLIPLNVYHKTMMHVANRERPTDPLISTYS